MQREDWRKRPDSQEVQREAEDSQERHLATWVSQGLQTESEEKEPRGQEDTQEELERSQPD